MTLQVNSTQLHFSRAHKNLFSKKGQEVKSRKGTRTRLRVMSFKKATKGLSRAHKERAQPKAREKLGILEKHKDYKLRADDYKKKQRHIQALREKAAFRNPDEFYFAMTSSRTEVSTLSGFISFLLLTILRSKGCMRKNTKTRNTQSESWWT